MISLRSPSIRMPEWNLVEMAFISKYKLVWAEMLPYQHLEGGTVIFVTFNSRPCVTWHYFYKLAYKMRAGSPFSLWILVYTKFLKQLQLRSQSHKVPAVDLAIPQVKYLVVVQYTLMYLGCNKDQWRWRSKCMSYVVLRGAIWEQWNGLLM